MAGRKKKNKNKSGRIVSTVVLVAALAVLVFALWRLIPILKDYHQSESAYTELTGQVVDLGENEAETGTETEESDWRTVTIDFDALKAINPDVIGWIRFDDTDAVNVDYPILHGATNNTYLRTNLYGESFTAGSIFLEASNSPDFSDRYNIVYGHNMKNESMFGMLKKYNRDADFWYDNQFFTIYTPEGAYRYRIFAYETVDEDSVIYTVGYGPDEDYQSLIDWILSCSEKNTGIIPRVSDRIVSLSTCTPAADNHRFVVCGVCVDQYLY